MNTRIRPMTQADKPVVMGFLPVMPEFPPSDIMVAEEVIDSYLADPEGSGYFVMVAELGTEVAGYIAYGPAPLTQGTWDIYWVAVNPARQHRGLGRRLLAFAEDEIGRLQGRLILIETSSIPGYDRTRRFYISLGYRLACQIKDYYTLGDDKLIYEKRLGKAQT
jgi:ribosomal protein S18 acetylase RimI-like enzyme